LSPWSCGPFAPRSCGPFDRRSCGPLSPGRVRSLSLVPLPPWTPYPLKKLIGMQAESEKIKEIMMFCGLFPGSIFSNQRKQRLAWSWRPGRPGPFLKIKGINALRCPVIHKSLILLINFFFVCVALPLDFSFPGSKLLSSSGGDGKNPPRSLESRPEAKQGGNAPPVGRREDGRRGTGGKQAERTAGAGRVRFPRRVGYVATHGHQSSFRSCSWGPWCWRVVAGEGGDGRSEDLERLDRDGLKSAPEHRVNFCRQT